MAILRVKINENSRIIDASPATYAGAVDGWIVTDNDTMTESAIIRLSDNLTDGRGVHLYKFVGNDIAACNQEEMDEEYASLPPPEPTDKERIAQLEAALTAIGEGIASV